VASRIVRSVPQSLLGLLFFGSRFRDPQRHDEGGRIAHQAHVVEPFVRGWIEAVQ
jgi:hypothetical protein